MKINQAGLDIIKEFEGLKLKAYKCPADVWTIGYGHTGDEVVEGMEIDEEMAESLLLDDVEEAQEGVSQLVKYPHLNENQFSALVSFAYNVGLENLRISLLLRCLNLGNPKDAAEQFLRWNKAGGKVLAGLTRRRQAERKLFLV